VKVFEQNVRNLRRNVVVFGDQREIESYSRSWLIPALGANVCVVVIADTGKDIVSRAVLSVEVDGPFVHGPCLEAAKDCMRVVVLCFRLGRQRRRRIRVGSESANSLLDASSSVSITEMD